MIRKYMSWVETVAAGSVAVFIGTLLATHYDLDTALGAVVVAWGITSLIENTVGAIIEELRRGHEPNS